MLCVYSLRLRLGAAAHSLDHSFIHSLTHSLTQHLSPSVCLRLVLLCLLSSCFGSRCGCCLWFPCGGQRLAPCDLLRIHLSFRCAEFGLIKIQIILSCQLQPHFGLNGIAWKLLIAQQVGFAEEQLGVLLPLLGRKPQPLHSFRDVPMRQQII